jgi:phenylacetate-CoA ligase
MVGWSDGQEASMKQDILPADMVHRKLLQYRSNQMLDRNAFERVQLTRFRALATHAYRRSPYYRRLIDERAIRLDHCTPQDFPILTKASLIAHFDDIVTDRSLDKKSVRHFLATATGPTELLHGRYVVRETSGTSGERLPVVSSLDECAGLAAQMRRFEPDDSSGARFAFIGVVNRYAASYIGVSHLFLAHAPREFLPIDVGMPLRAIVEQLNDFRPNVLCGYTSAILALASVPAAQRAACRPSSINCVGEAMPAPIGKEIEKAFGCVVTNVYGTTEFGVMGIGRGENMLLLEDDLIYEFMGDHVNVTSLDQYTMPLIRYVLHDALARRCHRGAGPYTMISSRFGRTEEVIRLLNDDDQGEELNALAVIGLSLGIDGLSQYQVVVEGERTIRFRFSLANSLPETRKHEIRVKLRDDLTAMLKMKGMTKVSLLLDETESTLSFADPLTGKTRLVRYGAGEHAGHGSRAALPQSATASRRA